MRLIDADTLLEHLDACVTNGRPLSNLYDLSEIVRYVKSMPTIDAVEVVHGNWEVVDQEEPRRYGCSVCKRLSFYATNYCPCCGAKIDGVVKIEESEE